MNYIMKYIMNFVDEANCVDSLYWMLLVGMVLLAVATLLLVLEMKGNDKLALRCAWLEHELKIEKDRSKFFSDDNQRLSDECWEIYERYGDVVDMCNDLRTKLGEKMLEEKKVEQ